MGVCDAPTLIREDNSDILLAVAAVTIEAEKYQHKRDEMLANAIVGKLAELF